MCDAIVGESSSHENIINIDNTNVLNPSKIIEKEDADSFLDIYDPRNWDMLNVKLIEILAVNGPKRDLSIVKGPKNKVHRRFVSSCYIRELPNGETSDRKWLVYSKELDKVFCFCCKVFKKGIRKSQLAKDGLCDWSHIIIRLKEHEKSKEHMLNMSAWIELRHRLKKMKLLIKLLKNNLRKKKNIGKMY